ncbi:hypothetical protein [Vibrio sp. PID23_8]|uniref:hypothetical protein n=1 Tax=Vibrio sp. PID23_8 TaxID=1583767 RepID=UPI000E68ACAB|nr:hypothetical protein [Vibrio sp. PID23_8]
MEKLVEKLTSDPHLEHAFVKAINAKTPEFNALYLEDVKHTREIHTKSPHAREFIYRYAWLITAFAFAYIGAITFLEIPEGSQRFADTILGFILGTVLSVVIQFFYGASKPIQEDE